MTSTTPETTLRSLLERPGIRCLAPGSSDYLILEKTGAAALSSKDLLRDLRTFGSRASGPFVLLWNRANQVEVLIDLNNVATVRIKNFAAIRAVGLSPELSHRLGRWTRQRKLSSGLWKVVFEEIAEHTDPLSRLLEQQILKPWIEGYTLDTHSYDSAARRENDTASYPHQVKDEQSHYLVGFKDLHTAENQYRVVISHFLDSTQSVLDHVRQLQQALCQLRALTEKPARHEQNAAQAALVSQRDAAPKRTQSDRTTEASTPLPEALSSTSQRSSSETDPVQNAIEIRQKLMQTVNMVDAAKWAQWRGVRTKNPSAALGKYKRQHRIFAVKSGNRDLYPAFQFSPNAEPLPIIREILREVPEDAQGWALLSWFEARNTTLGNRKPSELVASEPSQVLNAAKHFYSRDH